MADEPAMTEATAAPRRFSKKTLGIVLAVAVVQGLAFFLIFKLAGGTPEPAHGEGSHALEAKPAVGFSEVSLLKSFKVPNDKTGRLWIYDIDLSVVVKEDRKGRMLKIAEARAAEIGDRVARIVRAATDQMLREDDLEVLRGQLAEALAEVTEDESLIERVLIPRFVPIPS